MITRFNGTDFHLLYQSACVLEETFTLSEHSLLDYWTVYLNNLTLQLFALSFVPVLRKRSQ